MVNDDIVNAIDLILPQMQCKQCNYSGCFEYAKQVSLGLASIDRCIPGGIDIIQSISKILNINIKSYLSIQSNKKDSQYIAKIKEIDCIGCSKCAIICPVDAIIGSKKYSHTVIPYECTGCGLCIQSCPVNCIKFISVPKILYNKDIARKRYNAKKSRNIKNNIRKKVKHNIYNHKYCKTKEEIKKYILDSVNRITEKKRKLYE